jgi:hypothetical protein
MDLAPYLTYNAPTGPPSWSYDFPNGHSASVVPDPHRTEHPFRFEVWSTDPADDSRGNVAGGLTTDQVEAKLHQIAWLPPREGERP